MLIILKGRTGHLRCEETYLGKKNLKGRATFLDFFQRGMHVVYRGCMKQKRTYCYIIVVLRTRWVGLILTHL